MNEIERFIENFKKSSDRTELFKTFTEGYCYHFALILDSLFRGQIVYDMINCHFMFMNYNYMEYYDISGRLILDDISHIKSLLWIEDNEEELYKNLFHNCIYKDKEWKEHYGNY